MQLDYQNHQKIIGKNRGLNGLDKFTLTRKWSYPELVWNQNPLRDDYFRVDEESQWKIQN